MGAEGKPDKNEHHGKITRVGKYLRNDSLKKKYGKRGRLSPETIQSR